MRHRSVADLMTPTAVAVQPGTSFKEIARLLDEYGITAVPVVDEENRPVGVVSEADLLRRHTEKDGPSTAEAMMSSPVVTARPSWTAVEAARLMERHRVKRLPVVDADGRLIGVLSRSDLLQLFLRRDRSIQEEIREDVVVRILRLSPPPCTSTSTRAGSRSAAPSTAWGSDRSWSGCARRWTGWWRSRTG